MTTEHDTGYKARLLDESAYHLRNSTIRSAEEAVRMLSATVHFDLTDHEHETVTTARREVESAISRLNRARDLMQELMPKENER